MHPDELIEQLARYVRRAVIPFLGKRNWNEVLETGQSGDFEFPIDTVAERSILEFLDQVAEPCSIYSEAQGLVETNGARHLLIIDPVDGTRPARAGFEQCVVSVARLDPGVAPNLGNVTHGCLAHLKSDAVVVAERGAGALENGARLQPSSNADIRKAPLAFEIAGRPAEHVTSILSPLIDTVSLGGGAFLFSSTAYALWQISRGSLDVFADVAPLAYRRAGRSGFGMKPYDIAAAKLIAIESGCMVTDIELHSLDPVSCLFADDSHTLGVLAANGPTLHNDAYNLIHGVMQ